MWAIFRDAQVFVAIITNINQRDLFEGAGYIIFDISSIAA